MKIDYTEAYKCVNEVQLSKGVSYPLDIVGLVKSYGILLVSYEEFGNRFGLSVEDLLQASWSEYGFLARDRNSNRAIIYYNNTQPNAIIRFTLGHELGHYLMEHLEDNKDYENLVNCFARNLIAPPEICRKMGYTKPIELMTYFGITESAAKARLDFLSMDAWYFDRKLFYLGVPLAELDYLPF